MKRKNENGEEEKFYPITHSKAVISGDGVTLDEKIDSITCESIGAATEGQLGDTFDNVDVLATAFTLPRGIYYFKATCTNRPTDDTSGYHVIVSTRENGEETPAIKLIAHGYDSEATYYNTYNPDTQTWTGWTTHFLPLNGGTLTGNLGTSGHIYPITGATSCQLGTTTNPWYNTMATKHYLYDTNKAFAGSLRSDVAGTTDTEGLTYLILGNEKPTGTDGNATGQIFVYDKTAYYARLLTSGNLTANRNIYFPNAGGTMVTTASGATLTAPLTFKTANTSYGSYYLRGIAAGTSPYTANSTAMTNGTIYLQYE